MASSAASAPLLSEIVPFGPSASRGLMRISVAPCRPANCSDRRRTEGMRLPAPHSMTTLLPPELFSPMLCSHDSNRFPCWSVRSSAQPKSLNIKMLGRATAPQPRHIGDKLRTCPPPNLRKGIGVQAGCCDAGCNTAVAPHQVLLALGATRCGPVWKCLRCQRRPGRGRSLCRQT